MRMSQNLEDVERARTHHDNMPTQGRRVPYPLRELPSSCYPADSSDFVVASISADSVHLQATILQHARNIT